MIKRVKTIIIGMLLPMPLILLAAYISTLQPVSAAQGQESSLTIKSVNVSIWPEYDDPRVLVIYHGLFGEMPPFSTWVDFYIPQTAEIVGAGIDSPDGRQLLQEYNTHQEGKRTVLSINLSAPSFFLEYYYDPFEEGPLKSFAHKIENKYPVDIMIVRVQKPLKAKGFTLMPEYDTSFKDPQGFEYFQYNLNGLVAESSVNITVAYTKEDPNPSTTRIVQPQQGLEGPQTTEKKVDTPPVNSEMPIRIFIGVILIVAAVVGATFFMKKAATRRNEAISGDGQSAPSADDWNFCPDCGTRLSKDYKFCPDCGKKTERRSR